MKIIRALIVSFFFIALSGCASSGKVFSDFDLNQNFTQYKTFSWFGEMPGLVSGTYPVSALTKSRMKESIQAELEARGFGFTEKAADADFLVSFTLGARDKIATRHHTEYKVNPNAWRWGRAYYPHYYYPNYNRDLIPVTTERTYQFTEGSIAIDIFDAADKRPVWHSSASKRLSRKELSGSQDQQADTVQLLLEGFPP